MALIRSLPLEYGVKFVSRRVPFLIFSAFLMLGSIGLFLTQGLNFGVDFRGGILMEVRTEGPADLGALRDRMSGLGLGEVTIQEFGEPTDVLINVERQVGEQEEQIRAIQLVREALGEGVEIRRQEFVGPKVGDELKEAGFLATVLALSAIAFYIWFRFEWHFSVAALVALVHDVVATVGFYALTQIEFNLATLAAVLTIAGYSINDTVVVFDRVRGNLRRYKKKPIPDLLDLSINQTLSRTVITGVTTLLALLSLYFLGGEVIRGFAFAMIWGVIVGTYSSICIAVPLLLLFDLRGLGMSSEEPQPEDQVIDG